MKELGFKRFFQSVFANPPGTISCPGGVIVAHTLLVAELYDDKGNFVDKREVKDKVVTNAFVNTLVAALWSDAVPLGLIDDFKYHWSGTNTDAESATDTNLTGGTTGNTRQTGTQTTGTSSNIYKSVCTITYGVSSTDGLDIAEHGLFNSTSSTGDTLMDRTLFAKLTVKNGWSIAFTFTIEFTAGG